MLGDPPKKDRIFIYNLPPIVTVLSVYAANVVVLSLVKRAMQRARIYRAQEAVRNHTMNCQMVQTRLLTRKVQHTSCINA